MYVTVSVSPLSNAEVYALKYSSLTFSGLFYLFSKLMKAIKVLMQSGAISLWIFSWIFLAFWIWFCSSSNNAYSMRSSNVSTLLLSAKILRRFSNFALTNYGSLRFFSINLIYSSQNCLSLSIVMSARSYSSFARRGICWATASNSMYARHASLSSANGRPCCQMVLRRFSKARRGCTRSRVSCASCFKREMYSNLSDLQSTLINFTKDKLMVNIREIKRMLK